MKTHSIYPYSDSTSLKYLKVGQGRRPIRRIANQVQAGSPPGRKIVVYAPFEVHSGIMDIDHHEILKLPPFNKVIAVNDDILEFPEGKVRWDINGNLVPIQENTHIKNKEFLADTTPAEVKVSTFISPFCYPQKVKAISVPDGQSKREAYRNLQYFIYLDDNSLLESVMDMTQAEFDASIKLEEYNYTLKNLRLFKEYLKKLCGETIEGQLIAMQYLCQYLLNPSRNEIFVPLNYCNAMLDRYEPEVWKNPNLTWADLKCKSGIFMLAAMIRRFRGLAEWEPDEQKRLNHIRKTTYCYDDNEKNLLLAKKTLGDVNFEKKSVVDCTEPHDSILISPNFKENNDSTVWRPTCDKALELIKQNGYGCLLVPPGYRQPEDDMWFKVRGKLHFLKKMDEAKCRILFKTKIRADGIIVKNI